jgi:hypothetical protein
VKSDAVKVMQFTDGPTRNEVWELPDTGWNHWSAVADEFLAYSIAGIATEYATEPVEWLEINLWPHSGRLIVFPSHDGPEGDRGERVCFELASEHLLSLFQLVDASSPQADQAWADLSRHVWGRVSQCLTEGAAARELKVARRTHRLRIAGYDYQPGEGLWWLTEDGRLRTEHLN